MKILIGTCMMIASIVLVDGQQRVAPGVPPQQYQQQQQYAPPPSHQMPPQQQQQQQMPQQQMPPQQQMQNQVPQMQQQVQYQQVPVQQQQQMHQQQIPMQQQVPQHGIPQQGGPPQGGPPQGGPPQGSHGHPQAGHHGHQQQILNTANIMQEKEHIKEHSEVPIDISKMTEQELQFHYFKMHDADRNDKLDGCELIKSLIHWHGENDGDLGGEVPKVHTDEELESQVDMILKEFDKNNDGYIDFIEFKRASV